MNTYPTSNFTILITINPNKSPTNEVYQLNDPNLITEDLYRYFNKKLSSENALQFLNGGLFDVHPRYPGSSLLDYDVVVGMEGHNDNPGRRGRRLHWHIELNVSVRGKVYPWGNGRYSKNRDNVQYDSVATRDKYWRRLKSDLYKLFYRNGIISSDQFYDNRGIYMNIKFHKKYNYGDYSKKSGNYIQKNIFI